MTTGHNLITDLRIPFKSFNSAVSTDLAFQDGANVITNVPGYLQPRPGFSAAAFSGTYTGTVKKIFMWHRVNASGTTEYYAMVCSVDGSQSYVYKFKFGVDVSAALIRTCTTSNSVFSFVTSNQTCYFGKDDVSGEMWKYDGTTLSKWGIDKPSAPTVGTAAGSLNITASYYYRVTYGNSSTGHQSSPSDVSACIGANTGKKIQITLVASADAQVDKIHVYRTTDGGSTNPIQMEEIANSPFANANATVDDQTADVDLGNPAPALQSCDPPPAMRGLFTFQNRIGGFAKNVFYYSAFEEIGTTAVPEESFPSGTDGNQRPYSSPVFGTTNTPTGAAIFTARTIFGVDGDSLDSFRWGTILDQRGTKYETNVLTVGTSIVWRDTSGQIWLSDIGEMGKDIRTDTKLTTPHNTQFVAHNFGDANWLLVLDVENGRIIPANMDNQHWMVPWPISGITALASGETADGTVDLLAAINGTIYKLVAGTFTDAGSSYTPWVKTNLFKVAPDEQPDYYGVVDYVALETNGKLPVDIRQLNDDDPRQVSTTSGAWISIKGNEQDSTRRSSQGVYVVRKEYTSQPATNNAQRIALYIEWRPGDNFALYSLDIKHHLNV